MEARICIMMNFGMSTNQMKLEEGKRFHYSNDVNLFILDPFNNKALKRKRVHRPKKNVECTKAKINPRGNSPLKRVTIKLTWRNKEYNKIRNIVNERK